MKTFEVEITGITPLLQHRMPEEELFALLGAKGTKKKVKEELTPREIADRHAYCADNGVYYVPMEYLSGAFAHCASDYKQKNSIRKSIKSVAKGVFRPATTTADLLDEDNNPIKSFEVDIRKGVNHQKGAVAVCRPRFDRWKVKFVVNVDDTILEPEVCHEILRDAGKRSGIGSFRVSKNGYFGQFQVTSWQQAD